MSVSDFLNKSADEFCAVLLVLAGIVYVFMYGIKEGMVLITAGTSYLFGKNMPKRPENTTTATT